MRRWRGRNADDPGCGRCGEVGLLLTALHLPDSGTWRVCEACRVILHVPRERRAGRRPPVYRIAPPFALP
jgi:hypothetical protein